MTPDGKTLNLEVLNLVQKEKEAAADKASTRSAPSVPASSRTVDRNGGSKKKFPFVCFHLVHWLKARREGAGATYFVAQSKRGWPISPHVEPLDPQWAEFVSVAQWGCSVFLRSKWSSGRSWPYVPHIRP